MIVDSSAVIAILADEDAREPLLAAVLGAPALEMSAASYLEAAVVIDRRNDPVLSRRFDDFLSATRIAVVEVTSEQAVVARAAYRDFGKGSGHPAGLNFGDCFSYALARVRDDELLFIGDDFGHTDLRPAI